MRLMLELPLSHPPPQAAGQSGCALFHEHLSAHQPTIPGGRVGWVECKVNHG